MTQRHFAKVLNSIDVGIAGDRLESSLLQLKVFAPSYSFHFVLFFCCESADVDFEYFCCPVWMVCWSLFCFPLRCPVLFRLGSLVSLCHVRLMCIVGRCGSVGFIRFGTFRCQTVISVVHMDAYVLTLRLQLLGSFSFACYATTRF